MSHRSELWTAIRLRVKRRYLLARAIRRRRHLTRLADHTKTIRPDDILLFCTIRNEFPRLAHFLAHYRRLGVRDFLIVDNGSTDGGVGFLRAQPDVSLWQTARSYRGSRFGMDWLNWLLMRYGSGHWCVTVDADELLIYPDHENRPLPDLTRWLDTRGVPMMAAMMLDMYPQGRLSEAECPPGNDPIAALGWFDPDGYTWEWQPRFRNISIRGGPRKRTFFADRPEDAPHLHKTPLIRWHWRYAYVSSTHIALPRRLNAGFDSRTEMPTGVLLHTKFLDQVIDKSREEKQRREHFTHAERYDGYYDRIIADPVLWSQSSAPFVDAASVERHGLMQRGAWR